MTEVYGIDLRNTPPALEAVELSVSFEKRQALRGVSLVVPEHCVVALIGPSGSGKSTLLRGFNRMNDFVHGWSFKGQILLRGRNIHGPDTDPSEIRRRVGMISRRPIPFPSSVFENVAFGPRVHRFEGDLNALVEESLRQAGLWDEVNDRLFEPALDLSGGQQQRLCVARALAVGPEVLLMDEPTSELDPGGAQRIEELIHSLKEEYAILLVSHDLQQAARVSDYTAFFKGGELVEYGPTPQVFTTPREAATEAFITGRRG